jgi:hypothetical protein
MEKINLKDNKLIYRGQELTYGNYIIIGNAVNIDVNNDLNDCTITLVENETTINDVIQTSAQMIYDTLTSNV